jgi:hypothetical protein
MDKRANGLAKAMREIAEQRDNQLRNAGEISVLRRQELKRFLEAELPVETALFAAARRRDESLRLAEPALRAAMHASLVGEARSVGAARQAVDPLRQFYRTAAAIAAAAAVAAVALHFFSPGHRTARILSKSRPASFLNSAPIAFSNVSIFERSPNHLTLKANRLDLAALEPSLLTINRSLPDVERPDRVLPLDLPIRQIRLDVEAVRTP